MCEDDHKAFLDLRRRAALVGLAVYAGRPGPGEFAWLSVAGRMGVPYMRGELAAAAERIADHCRIPE
jgi:hypothetical protein